jgi:hypothetical protein
VIRHMEEGMARWGIHVPASDDEKTELALSFDDAEFQHDPGAAGVGAGAGAGASNGSGRSAESVGSDGSSGSDGSDGSEERLQV